MSIHHLRFVLDALDIQVWSISLDGVYQEVNAAHARFVGRPAAELVGAAVRDIIPESALGPLRRYSREAVKTGAPARVELWLPNATGARRLLDITQTPLRDASGALVGLACSAEDITERHATREALKQSEALLRRITDTIPGALVRYRRGPDGRDVLLYASERFEEVWGISRERVFEDMRHAWALVHPDDLARTKRSVERSSQELTATEHTWRMVMPDGAVRWLSAKSQPAQEDDGGVIWDAVVFDVTEHRRTQLQLADANMRMEIAADAARFGVWEVDVQTNALRWDSRMFQIYGVEPDTFDGTPAFWARCIHPADRDHAQRATEAAFQGEGRFDTEFRIITGEGQTRVIKAYAQLLRDARGAPSRFIGVNYDITDRYKSDDALRFQSQVLESISDLVLAVDLEGRPTYANAAARAFLGTPDAAAGGRFGCPSQGDDAPNNIIQAALDDGEWRGETHMTRADGQERWMRAHLQPLRAPEGSPQGVVGVLADITDHKRAEEEVLRMQRLDGLGLIASGIAHDFNNILMSVMGYLELAELDLPEEAPSRSFGQEAFQAIEQARQLTRQLMTFAKGEEPVLSDVDTRSLIQDTVALHLHGSNIALRLALPSDLWPLRADKGQLSQVLSNLTLNARQAMERGGTLHVSAENVPPEAHGPPHVRITLRDEGQGIDPQTLGRIFDPYFTTKASGHGLGLAVVHTIVRRHKGHIDAASAVGEGTTFTLFLPASPGAEVASAPIEARALDLSGRALRVLLMDDEAAIRGIGVGMLGALGVACVGVSNAEEALARYVQGLERGQAFDAVVLDLTIVGGPGGRDAMAALLSVDPNARAIAMSGYSSDQALARYREHGFAARLSKPFKLHELRDALLEALTVIPR